MWSFLMRGIPAAGSAVVGGTLKGGWRFLTVEVSAEIAWQLVRQRRVDTLVMVSGYSPQLEHHMHAGNIIMIKKMAGMVLRLDSRITSLIGVNNTTTTSLTASFSFWISPSNVCFSVNARWSFMLSPALRWSTRATESIIQSLLDQLSAKQGSLLYRSCDSISRLFSYKHHQGIPDPHWRVGISSVMLRWLALHRIWLIICCWLERQFPSSTSINKMTLKQFWLFLVACVCVRALPLSFWTSKILAAALN